MKVNERLLIISEKYHILRYSTVFYRLPYFIDKNTVFRYNASTPCYLYF